jgi:uncharacterized Ntn-hydrolase superfamily protein
LIRPSTFSIVAYDPNESALGIAVASKFLAVGSVVPWARAGCGAVATQSYANTAFGPQGLDLMAAGISASEALEQVLASDPGREQRQVGMIDHRGGASTFTGSGCHEWAGGLTGKGFAIQGNILAGAQVVQAMYESFIKTPGNLPSRLLQALLAGDRAGGDRRGRQSAALLVVKPEGGYGGYNDRWVDYRVDDHEDPVPRLIEIYHIHELYFDHSPSEDQLELRGENLVRLQRLMQKLGYYKGETNGDYDEKTRLAVEAFIGAENFEERTDFLAGRIDRPIYEFLFNRFDK